MKKSFLGYKPLFVSHPGLGYMNMSECSNSPRYNEYLLVKRLKGFGEARLSLSLKELLQINQHIPANFARGDLLLEPIARLSNH
jgi:hypothetical protein